MVYPQKILLFIFYGNNGVVSAWIMEMDEGMLTSFCYAFLLSLAEHLGWYKSECSQGSLIYWYCQTGSGDLNKKFESTFKLPGTLG